MTAIPADFDPMLELARARLAAYPTHGPFVGDNHAACPICHARESVHALGLAVSRREAPAVEQRGPGGIVAQRFWPEEQR